MKHGETFEEAVVREVQEEYGVTPSSIRFGVTTNVLREHEGKNTHWIALVHSAVVDPEQVMIGEPDKMDEIGWFELDNLPEPRHSMLDEHLEAVKDHILNA